MAPEHDDSYYQRQFADRAAREPNIWTGEHREPTPIRRAAPRSAGAHVEMVEPGDVEPRFRIRIDRILLWAIVFVAAVYFTAHVLVASGICPS